MSRYLQARYYDPGLGRFLSEDPVQFAGGINLFAYVANDPINMSDPSGLFPTKTHYDMTYDLSLAVLGNARDAQIIAREKKGTA